MARAMFAFGGGGEGAINGNPSYVDEGKRKKLGLGQHSTFALV